MKKIVPFKKDILFDTNLAEITSISLEHSLHRDEGNSFSGEFIISGEYKITEPSINVDNFNHKLPFSIDIDDMYDIEEAVVDIDDFYYEIVNNNLLNVHIDVAIDNLKEVEVVEEPMVELIERNIELEDLEEINEKEEINMEEIMEKVEKVKEIKEEVKEIKEMKEEVKEVEEIEKMDNKVYEKVEEVEKIENEMEEKKVDIVNFTKSLFDKIDDADETYATYFVYIVREGDNVDAIASKYGITKEDLEPYNDLSEVKIGDKLIIPSVNETNQ